MRIVELQGNSKGTIIVSHFEKLRKREKVIFLAEAKIKIQRKGGYTILPNEILRDHELNLDNRDAACKFGLQIEDVRWYAP